MGQTVSTQARVYRLQVHCILRIFLFYAWELYISLVLINNINPVVLPLFLQSNVATVKALNFGILGFILQNLQMDCFREVKYHANVLAVFCNNVTTQNP